MSGEQEKKPGTKKDRSGEVRGAWVALDADGVVAVVESSQLKAALAALPLKGSIVFWPFGKTRAEVSS